MTTSADFILALADLVPGAHPVSAADLLAKQNRAIARAMAEHSKHRPRKVTEDVDGTGAFDYALSELAGWADGFSVVSQVEYPVDDTDEDADVLDAADWAVYDKPAGKYLRFLSGAPQTGETFRVAYTGRHTCTALACTVAAADIEAVESLAAGYLARMLTAVYALDQDSSLNADSIFNGSKTKRFAELAAAYAAEYNDHMGIQPGKPAPACVTADWDVNYPGGADRLTHPRRSR